MFSVRTEEEARELLAASCPFREGVGYIAPELAEEQTLGNLHAFAARLADIWFNHMHREPERRKTP